MQSLRSLRLSRGLRLVDMENSLGIGNGLLSEMERGLRSPNKLTRVRIESFFDEKINWLDIPNLVNSPMYQTDWYDSERLFRSLARMITGLPEVEKEQFTLSAIRHLRKSLQ